MRLITARTAICSVAAHLHNIVYNARVLGALALPGGTAGWLSRPRDELKRACAADGSHPNPQRLNYMVVPQCW